MNIKCLLLTFASCFVVSHAADAESSGVDVVRKREGPIAPFSALTGPHAVGTTQLVWRDDKRAEPYTSTPGVQRIVIVQVWYPAQKFKSFPFARAPYLLSPVEFSGDAEDARKLTQINERLQTRSYRDAKLAPSEIPYPVVIFNPGGGNPRFSSSFVIEQLASHGFVVLAIEHLGEGMSTHLPDGTPLALDRRIDWSEINKKVNDTHLSVDEIAQVILTSWKIREEFIFPVVVEDTRFVLDKLVDLNGTAMSENPFAGRLDLERIGTLGWSQGGAAAIHLLVHDPRIKAAVDLDGQFMGEDKATLQTPKPFMLLHNASPHGDSRVGAAERQLSVQVRGRDLQMLKNSTGPRYDATIAGTDHGSFSDWRIFYSSGDQVSRQHAREREQLITDLTVSFFYTYLREKLVLIPMTHPLVLEGKVEGIR